MTAFGTPATPDVIHLSRKPSDAPVSVPLVNEETQEHVDVEIAEEILRMQKTLSFLMRQHGITKVEVTSKARVYVDTMDGVTYTFHNNQLIGIRGA